jgi:hypothetical protein
MSGKREEVVNNSQVLMTRAIVQVRALCPDAQRANSSQYISLKGRSTIGLFSSKSERQ